MTARRVLWLSRAGMAITAALVMGERPVGAQQVMPVQRTLKFFIANSDSAGPPAPVESMRIPRLQRKISLGLGDVPVHVALEKLSKVSELRFIYADDLLDEDRVVHVAMRDVTVAAALTSVLVDASVAVVLRGGGEAVLVPATTVFVAHDTMSMVTGTVTDSTGAPITADVYVLTAGKGGRTDASGRFAIGALLQGAARIRVRAPGWQSLDTTLTLAAHGASTVSVVLARLTSALAPVQVNSLQDCPRQSLDGFACRRRTGLGAYRDAREIAALTPIFFADIFDGVAGIRRVPLPLDVGIEATTEWRCIVYLENGHVPSWANVMRINFLDIVAFEYYDSADKVPEWYKTYAWKGREPCSLMVLWMRGAPELAK
jgi:hypothetical protein